MSVEHECDIYQMKYFVSNASDYAPIGLDSDLQSRVNAVTEMLDKIHLELFDISEKLAERVVA